MLHRGRDRGDDVPYVLEIILFLVIPDIDSSRFPAVEIAALINHVLFIKVLALVLISDSSSRRCTGTLLSTRVLL